MLAWVLSSYERSNRTDTNEQNIDSVISNTSCLTSLDTLPEVSSLKCCYNVVFPALRYDPINNVVMSSSPNYYIDACSGFCNNGQVDYTNKICLNDPTNVNFNNCITRISPIGCDGLSKPIARVGSSYYFVVSATSSICSLQYTC